MVNKQGDPVRVDGGGALEYRAQGAIKGKAFGSTVEELESFLDKDKAPQASKLFANMTEDEKKESAKRLLLISDDMITSIVAKTITDTTSAKALAEKLKQRRLDILQKMNIEDTTNPKPIDQIKPDIKPNLTTSKPPVTKLDLLFVDFKARVLLLQLMCAHWSIIDSTKQQLIQILPL